jgi:hypothetical protein
MNEQAPEGKAAGAGLLNQESWADSGAQQGQVDPDYDDVVVISSDASPRSDVDQIPDQTSDQVPDQTSDQVPDQTSDQVPDQTSDQVPDQTSDQVPDQTSRAATTAETAGAMDGFHERWRSIQSTFVDDPRTSVATAADLTAQVVSALVAGAQERERSLRGEWDRDGVDTEGLRNALRHYRSFLERLPAL